MRNAFCQRLVEVAGDESFIFLTGDLGFQALEPLREAMGDRFLNVGVAEQNMISVAAGLARSGLRPWAYSIAPFAYARPFEQIRNDICLHRLPVVVVGNGGGYGYGVMGATHHAIEDYGVMLTLQHMHAFIPVFDEDLLPIVEKLRFLEGPAYLRLGYSELPHGFEAPSYSGWRMLLERGKQGAVILVVGPLVGGILGAALQLDAVRRPAIWVLSELPIAELPERFISDLRASEHLVVVEEHVAQGSVGNAVAAKLMSRGEAPRKFTHITACGYPTGRYGSQKFHRKQCGLDPASVLEAAGKP